jgi:DNA-binding NarL/FixJ family response regulator
MMLSAPIEFWVITQVAIDLCLIILFVVFLRQVKGAGARPKPGEIEQVTQILEPVLRDAQASAGQFEAQLREKQRIVSSLNERLDSRIISLNLLLNRAEACIASCKKGPGENETPGREVSDLQQEIMTLAEQGLEAKEIASRLQVSKGEVTLVLDLKKRFLEMEQG